MPALLIWAVLAVCPRLLAEAQLSWQDNSDNEDGFHIERSDNNGSFERIATLPAGATDFEDTSAQPGIRYQYRVQAFNPYGLSGYTNVSSFELPVPISFEDWIARVLAGQRSADSLLPPPQLLSDASRESSWPSQTEVNSEKTLSGAKLPTLLCYAHGINPFEPDYTLLSKPAFATIDGRSVRCIERAVFKFSLGLESTLQESTDLLTWIDIPHQASVFRETKLHRWERISLPQNTQDRYYRLKVALPAKQSF